MSFDWLLFLLLFVPITFLIMIVYVAPGETDAGGVLRKAVAKTVKVILWVIVIVLVMQALQLVFLP